MRAVVYVEGGSSRKTDGARFLPAMRTFLRRGAARRPPGGVVMLPSAVAGRRPWLGERRARLRLGAWRFLGVDASGARSPARQRGLGGSAMRGLGFSVSAPFGPTRSFRPGSPTTAP